MHHISPPHSQEGIRGEDYRGTVHMFMFAGARWSFGSALCPIQWEHYEAAQTLSVRTTEDRLSWFSKRIENQCKTSHRVDARELYDHCAMDLAYSLESHCIICASTEQLQYQDTRERVL